MSQKSLYHAHTQVSPFEKLKKLFLESFARADQEICVCLIKIFILV
jgi:hypothetical protein